MADMDKVFNDVVDYIANDLQNWRFAFDAMDVDYEVPEYNCEWCAVTTREVDEEEAKIDEYINKIAYQLALELFLYAPDE